MSNARNQDLRFIVIGAGMAGILATIKLREAGYSDITIYEKNPKLGGTWYENTYPGLSCDVPSHLYSYDFAPNPEWSRQFSPGPEIREYFEDVAKRFGVFELIRFDTEATRCAFVDGRWQLELADGSRDQADFIIAATGVLHHPNLPDFEGLESFAGAAFHSARWDHAVATTDKKVGIVGTGSSAVQIVTALAGEVGELVLFQRTPQWIMPVPNRHYSAEEKENFRNYPEEMRKIRDEVSKAFIDGFANALVDADAVVIVGLGGVGLSALQGARITGAGKIIAVDTQEWKFELARGLGATDCINARESDPVAAVHDLTGGGADFVFECIGLVPTVQQAVAMTGRGGTTVLVGVVPMTEMVQVSAADLTLQEKKITGSFMGSNRFRFDMPKYIEFYLSGRLALDELVSSRIKLEEVNDAFDHMRKGEVARQVIVFD